MKIFDLFSSSPGNRIHLHFLSFDLEQQSDCLFDNVQIREGNCKILRIFPPNQTYFYNSCFYCTGSSTGPVLATLCGVETPDNLTSVDGHVLYIRFRSDFSTVGTGFQVAYQHVYGSVTIG